MTTCAVCGVTSSTDPMPLKVCTDPTRCGRANTRPLYDIAREIRRDWANVNYGAEPYLQAMRQLNSIKEPYGYDTGDSIVRYFLSNAATWRGETARRVKAELRAML